MRHFAKSQVLNDIKVNKYDSILRSLTIALCSNSTLVTSNTGLFSREIFDMNASSEWFYYTKKNPKMLRTWAQTNNPLATIVFSVEQAN